MPKDNIKNKTIKTDFFDLEDEFDAFLARQKVKEAEANILNLKKASHLLKEDDGWYDENYYEDEFGKHRASHLWAAAKGLPVEKVVITDLFDPEEWKKEVKEADPKYYEKELKRIERADLSYPIILTPSGKICDGFHRAMKAYFAGEKTIDAVRLLEMPGTKPAKRSSLEIKKVLGLFDEWLTKNSQHKLESEELTHPIEDIEAAALKSRYDEHKVEPDIKKLKEELETNPDVDEYASIESKSGWNCFFWAAIEAILNPELKLIKGQHSEQPECDTAHFWLEDKSGKIIDPTAFQYPKGKYIKEREVSALKNLDFIMKDPLFKTLPKDKQDKILSLKDKNDTEIIEPMYDTSDTAPDFEDE